MMKIIFLSVNILLFSAALLLGFGVYERIRFDLDAPALEPSPRIDKNRSPEAKRSPSPNDYRVVMGRNLFRTEVKSGDQPVITIQEPLKPTELQVKLWGTVTSGADGTYAVIEDRGKRVQNLYRVGDTIQDATIKKILREKVVLSVRGNDEVLEIEKLESGKARSPRPQARPRPATGPPSIRRIRLKRSQLNQSLNSNIDLSSQVTLRPHFTDGKQDGMILTGIKPNSIFRRMGLRNGDILLGIDESDIRSPEDISTIIQGLDSTSSLSVKIRRRGRLTTMNYTIE